MNKFVLIITGAILYPISYSISEYLYPKDTVLWDIVRHILYIIWGCIGYFSLTLKTDVRWDKFTNSIVYILVYAMALPAAAEKLIMLRWPEHKDNFTILDVLFIGIALYSIIKEFSQKCSKSSQK